jgi:Uma2 family endonuclease
MEALHLGYSFDEYVRFERDAREKHEYVRGLILAMAGGTLEHSALISAVNLALGSQLRGRPCRTYESNARIRVRASGNAYYPDGSVVCGKLEPDPEDGLSISNPAVLFEVLSPSTAEYDRTDKLADYRRIPSLRHIVHVFHDELRIDVWTRDEKDWAVATYRAGESASLTAVGCTLDVSEIYRDPLATRPRRRRPSRR